MPAQSGTVWHASDVEAAAAAPPALDGTSQAQDLIVLLPCYIILFARHDACLLPLGTGFWRYTGHAQQCSKPCLWSADGEGEAGRDEEEDNECAPGLGGVIIL